MQHLRPGNLVSLHVDELYYSYLVLSNSAFFGCQWVYAFHHISDVKPLMNTLLSTFGNGFYALIDFIEPRRMNNVIKLGSIKNYESYDFAGNLKARIKDPHLGYIWYIYTKNFRIIEKTQDLKIEHYSAPIASGMNSVNSITLIKMKWKNDQVKVEGIGNFPF